MPALEVRATNLTHYYSNVINYTEQAQGRTYNKFTLPLPDNKILLFMTSMFMFGTNEGASTVFNPVNLVVSAEVVSETHYNLSIRFGVNCSLVRLHFSMIIFNQADVQASGLYMLVYEKIDFTHEGGFRAIPPEFVDNFIMGWVDFSTNQTQVAVHFSWTFTTINGQFGVYMPVSVGKSPIARVNARTGFTMFYLKTWICPNQTLFHPILNLCMGCPINNCLDCLSVFVCRICNQSAGYFLNTNSSCQQCTIPGCSICSNLTSCLQCDYTDNYYPNASACSQCDTDSGLFLNHSTYLCQQCSIVGCILCASLDRCIECDGAAGFGYKQATGTCELPAVAVGAVQVWGHGCNRVRVGVEVVQEGYNFEQDPKYITVYTENVQLQSAEYIAPRNLEIVLTYSQDILEPISISLAAHSASMALPQPSPLPALLYSAQQCLMLQSIERALQIFKVVGYILLLLSVLTVKIVGLQLFGVLQLAYFVLPSYPRLNVYMATLRQFSIFNGWNQKWLEQPVLGGSLGWLGYSARFLNNCNVMLLVMLVEVVVAVLLYLTGRCLHNCTLKRIGLRLLKQGFVFLVMFNSFNIAYAAAVQIQYNQQHEVADIAVIAVALIGIVVCVYFMERSSPMEYGQFKDKFKLSPECQLYIALSITLRLAMAVWLSLETHSTESTLVISGLVLLFLLYNLVNLPFLQALHNYRACYCHCCYLLILLTHSYYTSMNKHTPAIVSAHDHTPAVALLAAVLLCFGMSCFVLAYEIYTMVRQWRGRSRVQAIHCNPIIEQSMHFQAQTF